MFMPKGRQLSAMGKEGLYAEDRGTAVYAESGTGSTGSSSGTPSPSFFPIKTAANIKSALASEGGHRDKLDTPNSSHHRKMKSKCKNIKYSLFNFLIHF